MARWTVRYRTDFDPPPTWSVLDADGNPLRDVMLFDDGGDWAAQANSEQTWETTDHGQDIAFDPQTLYRLDATARTVDGDPAPGIRLGTTGIGAAGQRVNRDGNDSLLNQYYAALNGAAPDPAYMLYSGYLYGTHTPGDAGPNRDTSNPLRVHPDVTKLRPLVRTVVSGTGTQNVTSFAISAFTAEVVVNATSRPSTTPGMWTVELRPTTEALAADYDAWRVFQGTTSRDFVLGELPTVRTYDAIQQENTTETWWVMLYKRMDRESTEYNRIASGSQTVSTDAQNRSLVVTADGTLSAYVEIQQWPERERTRQSATLVIPGRTEPVVLQGPATMAKSAITFLTRTESDRQTLEDVLEQPGPLRLLPYCSTIPRPWFMPGTYRHVRVGNRADGTLWLTECAMQEIERPLPSAGPAAPPPDGAMPQAAS